MDAVAMEQRLGHNLRAVRVAAGMTQADVADRANLSLRTVSQLEAGKGSTVSTLLKVLRVLGRDDWVDALAPAPPPFNPLDLLAARQSEAAGRAARPRARRRGAAR